MMKKIIYLVFPLILTFSCTDQALSNLPELADHNPQTHYTGKPGLNKIHFDYQPNTPLLSYKIYSSGEHPASDPASWTLKGSNNGKKWTVIDCQSGQTFCSRFQEKLYTVQTPGNFNQYLLEVSAGGKNDTLRIGDVIFYEINLNAQWKNFKYPNVEFKVLNPDTEGSKIYHTLVQDPDLYVKYHTQKVAEILFYSDKDSMNDVQEIDYTLKDYDGISAKGGRPPVVTIVYSTRHVEKSAKESLYKLDYETRGVLYHELVHAYQFEPKGIGTYSTNKEFWACIEGMADAVRAQAGLFDIQKQRKPGGHWLDGYQRTGFFIQWLTTKDPDAIRRFHQTVRDLPVWSFDAAIKKVFGPEQSIESMWQEYQDYLTQTKPAE